MKLKWKLLLITFLICLIGGIPASFIMLHYHEQQQAAQRNARALALAQQLVADGDASAACSVIALHANHNDSFLPSRNEREYSNANYTGVAFPSVSAIGSKWLLIDIEAATQAPHPARLQWLASRYPQAIAQHEAACQVLAAAEWAAGDRESAARIAEPWLKIDTMNRGWLPIALRLAQASADDMPAAEQMAREFSQRPDRRDAAWGFIHLALMYPDNLPLAARYLDQAFEADPTIPELRSFRGNLLEEQGLQEAAIAEYEAAVVCAPTNSVWRDNLAEAHIRAGHIERAIAAWAMACAEEASSHLWIKALFWARISGVNLSLPDPEIAQKDRAWKLAKHLWETQNEPAIWQADIWRNIPGHQRAERGRPEAQWLALLQDMIDNPKQTQSWHTMSPEVQSAYPITSKIINEMIVLQIEEAAPSAANISHISPSLWGAYQAGDSAAINQFKEIAQSSNWFACALHIAGWQAMAAEFEQAHNGLVIHKEIAP